MINVIVGLDALMASLSSCFLVQFHVWVCSLYVKAAAVIQPAPWEEVSEGPGSGHLTGPTSHCAHCHQRYFPAVMLVSFQHTVCYRSRRRGHMKLKARVPNRVRYLILCDQPEFHMHAVVLNKTQCYIVYTKGQRELFGCFLVSVMCLSVSFVSDLFSVCLAIRQGEDRHELLEKTLLKLRVDQKGNRMHWLYYQ